MNFLPLIIKYWKPAAAVIVFAIICQRAYAMGANHVQEKWNVATLEAEAATAAYEAKVRRLEWDLQQKTRIIDNDLTKQTETIHESADAILSASHTGDLRLRDEFRCPEPGRVPEAATTPGTNDGTDGGGLSNQHAEFLIRLAERADTAVARLTACQNYVRTVTQ